MNFCSHCGSRLTCGTPPGDDRERFLCTACGAVHYQNPRVVVGCIVAAHGERVLLCRRAIDPCYGKWTLPAGYLENGETVEAGAVRETREEAGARIEALTPYRMFNICHINQIYLMFRAQLADGRFQPGKESLDVGLFTEGEIPWDDIAFRVISETLRVYFRDRAEGVFPFLISDIAPAARQTIDHRQ
ncbi:MAG: NUDIX hydrolase [Desulfobacteraceae bacterium]|nr:MAG: NUDIX hydrolase [Desulfobacteraceae bacterium]